MTNLHVIKNANEIYVIPFGGMAEDPANDTYYNASITKIELDKDLAIIKVNSKLNDPIIISKECDVNIGQTRMLSGILKVIIGVIQGTLAN